MAGRTPISSHSKPTSKPLLDASVRGELEKLDPHEAARRLLGCELVRTIGGERLIGRIVETESYEETDAAAHSFGGPRGRNLVMFGPAGFTYVYFTYGMHYCLNVVTGQAGKGEAVLIRALEPLERTEIMQQNRHLPEPYLQLTNGPAKLTRALDIDADLNGHDLSQPPLQLILRPATAASDITVTTRVGIRHNTEHLQRFYLTGNPWISRR